MTPKQQAFVREYLIDGNASAAYRRAGFTGTPANAHAGKLMAKSYIKAAIATAENARLEATGVTQAWVVEGLRKEAERVGKDASHGARVAAYTTLAKHLGMLTERVNLEAKGSITVISGVPRAPDE